MVGQVAMRLLPAKWSATRHCACPHALDDSEEDYAVSREHGMSAKSKRTDPLIDPSVALGDTIDSFTPTTLEDMVAQQEETLMVSTFCFAV